MTSRPGGKNCTKAFLGSGSETCMGHSSQHRPQAPRCVLLSIETQQAQAVHRAEAPRLEQEWVSLRLPWSG